MDVTQSVLSFPNSSSLPQHLNHTVIALIPKVNKPELVSKFRPISLCNVLYKIFSKVLANRLKRILLKIITTEHQSAFTKNCLIFDNIMAAFETLHSMQHHNSVKDGFMALNLDMSKIYDSVEWSFLESVMRKMGFNEYWIFLLMFCVKMVSYFILVNGEPKGFIMPTRVLDNLILFPLSYSFYTLKGSMVLFLKRLNKGLFTDSLWVREVQSWPIFYLQMSNM